MRVFSILDATDNLSFFDQRAFYTMLLGVLLFNYFYVILFGGISFIYMWLSNFSVSSLVTGYFVHYAFPFELEDFMSLANQLKVRMKNDMDSVFNKIEWKKPSLFVNSGDVEEISSQSDESPANSTVEEELSQSDESPANSTIEEDNASQSSEELVDDKSETNIVSDEASNESDNEPKKTK